MELLCCGQGEGYLLLILAYFLMQFHFEVTWSCLCFLNMSVPKETKKANLFANILMLQYLENQNSCT